MKKKIFVLIFCCFLFTVWSEEASEFNETEKDMALINSRLSHSQIVRIDDSGLVRIKSPDRFIEFPIGKVSFNYNDSDHRVRVAGENNIVYYFRRGRLDKTSHRQSFTCRSRRMAEDVIDSFRRIKDRFSRGAAESQWLARKLPVPDRSLGYENIQDALRFVNDSLQYSLILNVDENGLMSINAPSAIYRVDLKNAEFARNDGSSRAKLRIYGEWCVSVYDEDGRNGHKDIPRESFAVHSHRQARQCVQALYFVRGVLLGETAEQIDALPNVRKTVRDNYKNLKEAIEYINDRLRISIVTGMDDRGRLVVNASSHIYKIPIRSCSFRPGRNQISFLGFGLYGRRNKSVEIHSRQGIERFSSRDRVQRIDSESFAVKNYDDIEDVVEALEFIRKNPR